MDNQFNNDKNCNCRDKKRDNYLNLGIISEPKNSSSRNQLKDAPYVPEYQPCNKKRVWGPDFKYEGVF